MSQRTVPAPFLTKTFQLVDDPASDDVVSWSDSGATFVVWKTAEFAKDMLPNYFKHNNFSSFVRQLNTYGFRKIVPDKWEFANEFFRRGQKELLTDIRRRKAHPTASGKARAAGNPYSGDELHSSSTSSQDSKNPGSVDTPSAEQFANLSDENEKLKRNNLALSSELAQKKKQCDELAVFLTQYLKVGPDQINRILSQAGINLGNEDDDVDNNDDDDEVEEGGSLKLFGVTLCKGKKSKKRAREEVKDDQTQTQTQNKEMKMSVDFRPPRWLTFGAAPCSGETSKICNY